MKGSSSYSRRAWLLGCAATIPALAPRPARGRDPLLPTLPHFHRMAPVVAHRGGSADAPENTLAAFATALRRGDRAIEADVQVTRDGQLVVFHDRYLSRTTDGKGAIAHTDSRKLRTLDAGRWKNGRFHGEHPPSVIDVLTLAHGRASVFLELKRGKRIISRLHRLLETRREQWGELAFISFDAELLAQASRRMPEIPRMYLRKPPLLGQYAEHTLRKARVARADYLGLDERGIHPRIVCRAHALGLGVYVFTVNRAKRARQLREMGVDGLISDRPATVRPAFMPAAPTADHRSGIGPDLDPRP